jgi:S1-C subfamily serine protease
LAYSLVRSRLKQACCRDHPRICARACLLALTLSFGLPALAQEDRAADSPAAEPTAAAVVQLLAVGPGERGMNRECAATGFLVSEEGYILTNAHVVEDARRCLAASLGTKIMAKLARAGARAATGVSCDVVGLDDLHDLAVLKTERPLSAEERPGFVRLDPAEVAEGTPVAVTGHPAFAWHPTTQRGRVIRRATLGLSEKSAEKSEIIVLDIPLQRGASGSPVYVESGGVVGVVERQNPSRPSETVAVPIRYAVELLDRHAVRWHLAPK